jgi:hypothetical protein
MIVTIRKCEVYQEVEKITSIIGSRTAGDSGSLYKQVWASSSDAPVLDTFWRDAVSGIYTIFKRYLSPSSVEYNVHAFDRDEVFTLSAQMPSGFDENLTGDVVNNMKSFFVATIVSGWFGLKFPDRAQEYAAAAIGYGDAIKDKLFFRKTPDQERTYKSDQEVSFDKGQERTYKTEEEEIPINRDLYKRRYSNNYKF